MVEPVISLDGLAKRFGRTIAVNDISMEIGEREIFGFLGANGAGKTTTIRMLCGLTHSTRGHGTIHGLDIWATVLGCVRYSVTCPSDLASMPI
jgi:ABC-2 type transport system ATP-binding protein